MSRAAIPPALAFVTLGCPKNQVDSENMLGLLVRDGFRTVGDPGDADVAVVNTCAFLQSAVKESRAAIAEVAALKARGKLRGLIVTGCLAQRAGEGLLADFPAVDAVLGTGQWRDVVQVARRVLEGDATRTAVTASPGGALDPDTPRALSTPRHLAYLKISEGCDHRCTFCIIPHLRGDQRSRPVAEVVAEARRLASHGVREINLIGQDTTGYGTDLPGRPTLADLLEALDEVETLRWIRVQYTYPRLWSDRLIEVWARAKRVVPYVDMPLQHIAQDMLRTMARAMTETQTRELVQRIKRGIPGVAFRTNFIVGFPGETEEHFETLERYVAEEGFDHVVVFDYEREPETPSHSMTGQVPVRKRKHRRARLLARQQQLSRERLARRVGERIEVMIDGEAGRGQWAARTAGQACEVDSGVVVEGDGLTPGECVPVRVIGASAYDLFARVEPAETHGLKVLGG
ncbi:MAG: 30S ribosomal protein S12 methylthiotransferase RimO [Candidatus Eisenbacteria bacterium]|uniref:Ribosomal protein uS12 methylthiotransferase RimO n=1 Tax=Eiseniibacteriota bacterium TaxID=2212470 RepID=A0A849SRG2_UNCEI|nr:30S ribosomal protein S12 methylthiotransferase RimO [Candidatus Eisenbacteria bacterium]